MKINKIVLGELEHGDEFLSRVSMNAHTKNGDAIFASRVATTFLRAEECEAALLAKGIAGETERGRSQRLDAVWSGEPLGICKAHPTKGAVCLEA